MFHLPKKTSIVADTQVRVRSAFDHEVGRYEPRPRRDWFRLLAGALAVFVLVACVTIGISYTYAPARILSIGAVPDSSDTPPFDQNVLTKVLKDFEQKKEAFQGLLIATSTAIVDPAR